MKKLQLTNHPRDVTTKVVVSQINSRRKAGELVIQLLTGGIIGHNKHRELQGIASFIKLLVRIRVVMFLNPIKILIAPGGEIEGGEISFQMVNPQIQSDKIGAVHERWWKITSEVVDVKQQFFQLGKSTYVFRDGAFKLIGKELKDGEVGELDNGISDSSGQCPRQIIKTRTKDLQLGTLVKSSGNFAIKFVVRQVQDGEGSIDADPGRNISC
ncbi:hypothetical protein GQ457_09G000280 [Hibiscus cannabinus]